MKALKESPSTRRLDLRLRIGAETRVVLEIMELTISILFITFALAAVTVKLISVLQAFRRKWAAFTKLPGPVKKPYPPLGHAMMLAGDSCDFYNAIIKVVDENIHPKGKEVGCIWFGMEPVLIVAGPNAAEVLMRSSEHMQKTFFYKFFHPWLGTGLLTSHGKKWKARRRLLTPSFHFSILNEFLKSMNDQSSILIKKLDPFAKSEEKFDIFRPITLCSLDIICETAMGESVHAQNRSDSEYVRAVYRTTELLMKRVSAPWLWNDSIFNRTSLGKDQQNAIKVLHDYTNSVIKDRLSKFDETEAASKKRKLALLDQLISASKRGEKILLEDIREEVDTFMFEGHDTTAAGMSWALHNIGKFPDVQKKIHNELDQVFGADRERPVTAEDLRMLGYLDMVLKESLRVLPSVALIGRVTSSDCCIDGFEIPANTTCFIALQAINKHQRFWENPEKFDPERFNPDLSEGRHPYAYVPFSAGPRNCIGQKFAIMEEKVVLAHILRKFEVETCDRTEDIRKLSDAIYRPETGINVILRRRNTLAET